MGGDQGTHENYRRIRRNGRLGPGPRTGHREWLSRCAARWRLMMTHGPGENPRDWLGIVQVVFTALLTAGHEAMAKMNRDDQSRGGMR
jgi:hypothetical protein